VTLRDESGFTLIELLVVMTISIVILSATLFTFNNLYKAEHDNDSRLDTVEVARNGLDVQARQLRNIAKRLNNTAVMDKVGSYDLIFQTSDPTRTWVRYCLDTTNAPASSERGRLWTQELSVASSAALPITAAMKATCPGPVAAGSWTSSRVVADYVTNVRAGQDRPLFSYGCTTGTTCASDPLQFDQIVNVTAQTLIDTTPGSGVPELRVFSGVYLRNQNQAPVASFVSTPAAGSPRTIVFNASGSTDYEGRTLDYFWFDQTMPAVSAIDCSKPTITFNADGTIRTLWGAASFMGESVTLSHTFPAGSGGTSRNIGLVVCDPGDRYGTAGISPTIAVQIPS
jgi:prepilin-type N-terminal cleavage/methylation domain-containing protein